MARNNTGNSQRPSETITTRKISGGSGPGPSMKTPGDGSIRRALLPRDRRSVDELSRADRSAAHAADAMGPIGGDAIDHDDE